MKNLFVITLLCAVASVLAQELPLAETCDETLCQLPDCRCSSTNIPGGLAPRNTPQFVTITFDDAVTAAAMPNYRDLVFNRRNSNGCPAGATFYVSHEWTDYSAVNELYNNGLELGLHSISHRTPQSYWMEATYDDIKLEIADQKQQIASFANISDSEIRGTRAPFLQLSGNNTFRVMKDYDITYDCSWGTIGHTNPGLWPYTLDYASIQDCHIPSCPSASIPGVWVQPMVAWFDLLDFPCVMADGCIFVPDHEDTNAWFRFILQNFERHYMGSRAPFGFYIHEAYLRGYPQVKEAMLKFIELINNLNDVFMVNSNEVIEWVKDPVPLSVYRSRPCRSWVSSPCQASVCELVASHNGGRYYMTVCGDCPRTYPWVGNPLGN